MKPLWERYPQRENDTWDSLGLFLEGYAFERQGRRPDYAPAAVDCVMKAKGTGEEFGKEHVNQLWDEFSRCLGTGKLNEANNPLCPRGKSYNHKRGSRITKKESVLEFLVDMSGSGRTPNIIVYAKSALESDQVKVAHDKIKEINGIGSKIASLFLRDVATFYNVFPSQDRHLLQPIDIWVRRIVKELGGPVLNPAEQNAETDDAARRWIVGQSSKASIDPETVNQGMWYFATQIAGSYYRLQKSIHDAGYAKVIIAQHQHALKRAANAADSL